MTSVIECRNHDCKWNVKGDKLCWGMCNKPLISIGKFKICIDYEPNKHGMQYDD